MADGTDQPDVCHVRGSRFEVRRGEAVAYLSYMLGRGRIVFSHTEVPEALQGKGVAGALARAGLAFARDEGLTVEAWCPFVQAHIERHPESVDR